MLPKTGLSPIGAVGLLEVIGSCQVYCSTKARSLKWFLKLDEILFQKICHLECPNFLIKNQKFKWKFDNF
jgi:hypothetical protein